MNPYEYAMSIEKEGEIYYRDLAKECSDEGLAKIFTMLADEEAKHYADFEAMSQNANLAELPRVDVFKEAKKIFEALKESGNIPESFPEDQITLYRNALKLEEKSYDFYTQKANALENISHKDAFLRIAKEEWEHARLIEGIIQYITYPQRWIESAEFHALSSGSYED
ncbi:MAG: ferritin family protein [Campylobacteraceae bacterium]|nr:ferritin family protein [Campylobacteraceae bacterium]